MSITDELREYAHDCCARIDDDIHAIADRIDAEHEDQLLGERNIAYNAGYDEGFASADDWLAQHESDMAEHGWVRLPKDADGEYIHIGDKLIDKDDKLQKPAIVKCILYNDGGCVVSDIDPRGCWYDPSLLRHYHAPTVEDVLREFANEVYADADNEIRDRDFLCAKYAKLLRLAKEDA